MENKKEEGFSYTSPELQRKNALKVLGIEAIIILIVVVLIFLALSYFGIFKVGDLIKEFQPNAQITPTANQAVPAVSQSTVSSPKIPSVPTILAVSDIKGYDIKLENTEKLVDLLNSWGVYNKEYQSLYGATGSTDGVPLKQVIIRLTDQQQPLFNYLNAQTKKVYTSSNTIITKGTFTMKIQISLDVLKNPGTLSPLGDVIRQTFLNTMYHISHPGTDKASAKKINDDLTNFFQNDPRAKVEYFKIEKK